MSQASNYFDDDAIWDFASGIEVAEQSAETALVELVGTCDDVHHTLQRYVGETLGIGFGADCFDQACDLDRALFCCFLCLYIQSVGIQTRFSADAFNDASSPLCRSTISSEMLSSASRTSAMAQDTFHNDPATFLTAVCLMIGPLRPLFGGSPGRKFCATRV